MFSSKVSLKSSHFLTELLHIMHANTTSDLLSTIYIILSFFQISGYIFKLNYQDITDSKLLFFLGIFYYSNFSNLLYYFSNETLTYVAFYSVLGLLHFLIFFPVFSTIIKRVFNLHSISSNPIFQVFGILFRKFFESFFWVLLTPFLEFSMNITDCEDFSYIVENRGNSFCVIPVYIWLLAMWICFLSFIITIVYMWTYTENSFLDTKSVKMSFNFCYLLMFLSRFIFVIVFPLIYNKNETLVYVFLHIIVLTAFLDYILYFPIRNPEINRKYIGLLCAMEVYFVIMTLWGIWKVIDQENLFYVLIIALNFGYKMGVKIHFWLYLKVVNSNFNTVQTRSFMLEEIQFLLQNSKNHENYALLLGIIRHHIKYCKEKKCKMDENHLKLFLNSTNEDLRAKIINDFIVQIFQKTIQEISKPAHKDHVFLEIFLMKYTSFLTTFNANPLKAFYEIQKIMKQHTNSRFLFKSYKDVLLRTTKETIFAKDKEKTFSNQNTQQGMEKELEVNLFLEILKEKKEFEAEAIDVLKTKISFWEKYKDGIGNYEEIMREISRLTAKIKGFQNKLICLLENSKTKSRPLFAYKMLSFTHSILLNDINEGMKMEDEVETTKKREYSQESNILSYISFFHDSMVPVKVSFLSLKGNVLEESKTKKLANFFSFSEEDLKSLSLNSIMPNYIAIYHERLFMWHLNRTSKKGSKKFIDTYGQKKSGLIFPINIYVGYGFEYRDDFVLQGLICEVNVNESTSKSVIFDAEGGIQGMDDGFFKLLTDHKMNINPKDLLLLNIFNLMPNLHATIDKNDGFNKKSMIIRNQASELLFPRNISEIIDLMRMKHREEAEFSQKMSYYSGITSKTKKSSNNASKNLSSRSLASESDRKKGGGNRSHYLVKLFTTKPNISMQKRSEIEEKSMKHDLDDKDILNELIEKHNCNQFRAYFDIKIHSYEFGENDSKKLTVFCLKLNKLRVLVSNTSMTYQETNQVSISMSQNIFPEMENPVSDIESGFVRMPPENIASFRRSHENSILEGEPQLPVSVRSEAEYKETNRESPRIDIGPTGVTNKNNKVINANNLQTDANLLTVENPRDFLSARIEHGDEEVYSKTIDFKKENGSPHEGSQYTQSLENQENLKKMIASGEIGNKNTTDKVALNEKDRFSGKPSSISTVKKSFSIFGSIHAIQTHSPITIAKLMFGFLFETLLIVIFCIAIYRFAVQYISDYYTPMETALENFSLMTTAWCTMTFAATEFELDLKIGKIMQPDSLEEQIMYEVFNRSLITTKDLLNQERDQDYGFAYEGVFKGSVVKYTETTFYKTTEKNFIDALDLMIGTLIDIIQEPLATQNVRNLEIFPLNFQYMVDVYNNVLDTLSEEFLNSNASTSQNILTIMLIFVILTIPLKLLELREIILFYDNLVKMLNIFLRVNQKSAFNEFLFHKEILENFKKDTTPLLFVNFPEKTINKKYFDVPDLNENSNNNEKNSPMKRRKPKKTAVTTHKFSFHNLRPISLLRPKLLLVFSFLLLFSFFFFIYLEWTIINTKINTLIGIHNYFYNFYSMPSHVFALNLLMFREKLLDNTILQASGEPTQTKEFREASVISELNEHLNEFGSFASNFPIYLFQISDQINSKDLDSLIGSDICKILQDDNYIDNLEHAKCEVLMNNAFQQGVISVMDQILNTVRMQQVMVVLKSTPAEIAAQLAEIRSFISTAENYDNLITEHFFEETNLRVFHFLTNFYTNLIFVEIGNMQTMIVLFTIGAGVVTFLIGEFYKRKFRRTYSEMSMCLSFIPYEKLINDDQTVFLIKKFCKA